VIGSIPYDERWKRDRVNEKFRKRERERERERETKKRDENHSFYISLLCFYINPLFQIRAEESHREKIFREKRES
jgi:hypothetical protein